MEKNVKQALGNIKDTVLRRRISKKFRAKEKWSGENTEIVPPISLNLLRQDNGYISINVSKRISR